MAWIRKMGVDSVEYHRATVLGRADDHAGRALGYYASRGETPLEWGGQLASRLGLVGAVDDASYEALFGPGGARDPHLGTRLVTTKRPGMELVVSATSRSPCSDSSGEPRICTPSRSSLR